MIDGSKDIIINYKEGYLHGLYKAFYGNGQLHVTGIYDKGIRVGRWISLRSNGELNNVGYFVDSHRRDPGAFRFMIEGEYIYI